MLQHNVTDHQKNAPGFTLIEISIALVIIALIAGGILVGQDLIHTAGLRHVISQYEEFVAATHTFKTKYTGMPGDMPDDKLVAFGFSTRTPSVININCVGDNDGLIEDWECEANPNGTWYGADICGYWMDMHTAGFYGNYILCDRAGVEQVWDSAQYEKEMAHISWIDGTITIIPVVIEGKNHFWFGGVKTWTVGNYYRLEYVFSPSDAFYIDSKLDDGKPRGGATIAAGGTGTGQILNTAPEIGADKCVETTGEAYNVGLNKLRLCHLILPM